MQYAEEYNIIVPEQHGFRRGRSCGMQLPGPTDELTQDLRSGKQVDLVVMNFSKAFDKVNHSLLLHKLTHYGITGRVDAFVKSFLTDRQHDAVVDGCRLSYVPVESGVPQGSVLDLALFHLYINDLFQQTDSNSRLFADNTICQRLISTEEDKAILRMILTHELSSWKNAKFSA